MVCYHLLLSTTTELQDNSIVKRILAEDQEL